MISNCESQESLPPLFFIRVQHATIILEVIGPQQVALNWNFELFLKNDKNKSTLESDLHMLHIHLLFFIPCLKISLGNTQ